MKIKLLLLFFSMALFSAAYGNRKCNMRGNMRDEWKMRKEASECRPVPTPVTLVANGYTGLRPSVEFVNRCIEDLSCNVPNMKCIPDKIQTKEVKATGSKGCVTIPVEEHLSCKCGCPGEEMCNKNQKYNARYCRCDCKPKVKSNCYKLREMYPRSGLMLNQTTCECKCPYEKDCGTGEFFSHDTCKCMLDKDNYRNNLIE